MYTKDKRSIMMSLEDVKATMILKNIIINIGGHIGTRRIT